MDDINEIEKDLARGDFLGRIAAARAEGRELSAGDQQKLAHLLETDDEAKAIYDAMTDPERLDEQINLYETIRGRVEGAVTTILHQSDEHKNLRSKRRLYYLVSGAAAAVAVTIGVLLFFAHPGHFNHPQAIAVNANDLPPGRSRATLTLADGKQIPLDSAHLGLIANQGNLKIMNQRNGQLIYKGGQSTDPILAYNTVSTPAGGEYKLILPDGTKVWLDALTTLRYPTTFTGPTRDIDLSGQAYFEVAHNLHPLVITTGKTKIQDVATAFNVSGYSDDPAQTITLLEGKVRVDAGSQSRFLAPGQQAHIPDAGKDISLIKNVDVDEAIAWKNNAFDFNNEDLPTIMRSISRWYNVTIQYNSEFPDILFSGYISRDLPASQVLQLLEETNEVKFLIEGDKIIVNR